MRGAVEQGSLSLLNPQVQVCRVIMSDSQSASWSIKVFSPYPEISRLFKCEVASQGLSSFSAFFCLNSLGQSKKTFLEIRDHACSPFLSSVLHALFFLPFSLLSSLQKYVPLQIRVLYLPLFFPGCDPAYCTSLSKKKSHKKSSWIDFWKSFFAALEQRVKEKREALSRFFRVLLKTEGRRRGGERTRRRIGELDIFAFGYRMDRTM